MFQIRRLEGGLLVAEQRNGTLISVENETKRVCVSYKPLLTLPISTQIGFLSKKHLTQINKDDNDD